jgi:hypothetical protein
MLEDTDVVTLLSHVTFIFDDDETDDRLVPMDFNAPRNASDD